MVNVQQRCDILFVKHRIQTRRILSDLACLVHSGEIKEGLERCHSELDEALSRFHVSSFFQKNVYLFQQIGHR